MIVYFKETNTARMSVYTPVMNVMQEPKDVKTKFNRFAIIMI